MCDKAKGGGGAAGAECVDTVRKVECSSYMPIPRQLFRLSNRVERTATCVVIKD